MTSPGITAVVCTRNRPERLKGCLDALTAALRPGDELLVVDSASDTPETRLVAEQAGARVIRCEKPGASRARNVGWRSARHDIVAFTDDDCRPLSDWLAELASPFEEPSVGWVTGSVGLAEEERDTDRPIAIVPPFSAGAISRATPEPIGSGNNFAIRTSLLREVGPFDERLGPGTWLAAGEDVELFDRLLMRGSRGAHAPRAVVHHQQWRSRAQTLRLDWGYGKGQGARLALLCRGDRRWGLRRCRELLWADGVRSAARDLRKGYEFGALSTATRTLGTLVGLCCAPLLRAGASAAR